MQTNTDPDKGVACFPPYGCGSDWNVCSTIDDLSATPMGQLDHMDAVRNACLACIATLRSLPRLLATLTA